MTRGPYIAVVFFLVLGLLFTCTAGIFSFVNVAHTPIELIYGTHGLVIWNAIASLCYFLVLCIYGGLFDQKLSKIAPISDLIRPSSTEDQKWNSEGLANLGYAYW